MAATGQLGYTYQFIRGMLSRSEMQPGTKLSRRRLAEQIGVSPALVQQALGQLEQEGLVERRPQSGTYVRELNYDEYENLSDLRELIEPYAAARAATRLTPAHLLRLQRACQRFRRLSERSMQALDTREYQAILGKLIAEEQIFHGIILKASGNPLLDHLISTLRLLARAMPNRDCRPKSRQLEIADEHEAILEALAARDEDLARERMLFHIRGSRSLLESLNRTSESIRSRAASVASADS